MKRINNILCRLLLAVLLLATGACKDEVALPRQVIALSTQEIQAPAIATTLTFDVTSNCEWTIEATGNDTQWADFSKVTATGSTTVSVAISENTLSEPRSMTLTVLAKNNPSARQTLSFTQASASLEGYMTIPQLRALATAESYTITKETKMRGIVVSSIQDGNFYENCLALQGSAKADNGITLRCEAALYHQPGEELEINLKNAVLSINETTGVLELKPESDACVTRTQTTKISPEALPISYAELVSGHFESMFVSQQVQVTIADNNKLFSDNVTVQTADDNRFVLSARLSSTFAGSTVPTGSGTLCGIVGKANDAVALMPRMASDIQMSSPRFDGGITLPYVFSIMTNTAKNGDGRYIYYSGANTTGSIDGVSCTAMDGSGATVTVNLTSKTSGNLAFRYWNENSGHHNLPLKSWLDGDKNYILLTLPLNEDIPGAFRLSFGLSATNGGPANWTVSYSNDNSSWHTPAPTDEAHFVIPKGKPVGSGKNFFYFSKDITPEVPLTKRSTLYIRISPYNMVSVSGGTVADGGEVRLHSCFAVERIPAFATAKPAGCVYFEPFDGLTTGLDYRFGDKLAAMMNFCGTELSTWDATVKNGLTGTHVYQRPGYAQIGFVETQTIAQGSYTNNVGSLTTPVLSGLTQSGNVQLTFDAMAYKNTSVHSNSTAKDIKGDLTSIQVEVIGGGTINGATTATVSGLSYTQFTTQSLSIEGATASTQIRFTSQPASGEFSRWFIDNICITK